MIPILHSSPASPTESRLSLTEVDLAMLPALGPLIEARIQEARLQHRLTLDRALDKVHHLIVTGQGAAFTDDLLLPTLAVVLHTGHSAVFEEKFCNVLLLFVTKSQGSPKKALAAVRCIEDYARKQKCEVINADSWIYRGGEDIGALWEHAGYEKQSISYIKHLNNK